MHHKAVRGQDLLPTPSSLLPSSVGRGGQPFFQGMMELGQSFEQYDQFTAQDQTAIDMQAGVIGLTLSMNCIKGTFSMRKR